jgi:hypothetical protein
MKDIIYDSTNKPSIRFGDFEVADSTQEHIKQNLIAEKGDIRFFPYAGIGASNWLADDENFADLQRAIQLGLETDGLRVTMINITGVSSQGELEGDVSAYYPSTKL